MPLLTAALNRFRKTAVTVAYRTETGLRDRLARRAVGQGWTPAVIPYSGYASAGRVRVLGRIVLAPASVDPAARRGIAGWRRLLTLESPHTEVKIELCGTETTVTSDSTGIVDARLPVDKALEPGVTEALLHLRRSRTLLQPGGIPPGPGRGHRPATNPSEPGGRC